ncbi:hypothetical protein Hanom_Chr11g00994591 [Helianthus anomalus]
MASCSWMFNQNIISKPISVFLVGMSKWYPVTNRYWYLIYQTGYTFGTDSVPTFEIFGTGLVLYQVCSVPVPTFEDFQYGSVPTSSIAMLLPTQILK